MYVKFTFIIKRLTLVYHNFVILRFERKKGKKASYKQDLCRRESCVAFLKDYI